MMYDTSHRSVALAEFRGAKVIKKSKRQVLYMQIINQR